MVQIHGRLANMSGRSLGAGYTSAARLAVKRLADRERIKIRVSKSGGPPPRASRLLKRSVYQRPLLVGSIERLQQQLRLRPRELVTRDVAGRSHDGSPIQGGRLGIFRLQQLQLRSGRSLPIVVGYWLLPNNILHPRSKLGSRLLLARQQAFRRRVNPRVIVRRKRFEGLPVQITRL